MTILCLPRPRDCDSRFLKWCAAARPSFSAVSAVTGSTFAVPRTQSVPKIFFEGLIELKNRSMFWRRNDADSRWLHVYERHAQRRRDVHKPTGKFRGVNAGQINRHANLIAL